MLKHRKITSQEDLNMESYAVVVMHSSGKEHTRTKGTINLCFVEYSKVPREFYVGTHIHI